MMKKCFHGFFLQLFLHLLRTNCIDIVANFIDFKLQPTRFTILLIEEDEQKYSNYFVFFHTACVFISGTKSTQNLNIFYSVIYSRPFRLIFDNCIHLKFVLRASKYLFPIYLTSIFCYCSHKMNDSIATRKTMDANFIVVLRSLIQ